MYTMWTVLVSGFIQLLFQIKTIKTSKHYFHWCVDNFSCSFDCFKKHKNAECTPAKTESQEKCKEVEARKPILQFTTEDTVDPEKLAQLGMVHYNE